MNDYLTKLLQEEQIAWIASKFDTIGEKSIEIANSIDTVRANVAKADRNGRIPPPCKRQRMSNAT